jgi:hypothetical protein
MIKEKKQFRKAPSNYAVAKTDLLKQMVGVGAVLQNLNFIRFPMK